jgi:SAM-dependent methyltransferase
MLSVKAGKPSALNPQPSALSSQPSSEGWHGWDQYAPFYDWENARTLGRRDVAFWQRMAALADGPVLELGCGTGRVSVPLARAGVALVGIDRSTSMLARAKRRANALRHTHGPPDGGHGVRGGGLAKTGRHVRGGRGRAGGSLTLVRGDIRMLPFRSRRFSMVLAPYGILQSLLGDGDLAATLDSVGRVLARGGTFGIDLVPDVPNWQEYENRVQLRGRIAGGAHLTLIESVRQERRRRLTIFEQRYVERHGRRNIEHRFSLTFRTLSVKQMTRRLERAGFVVDAVLGDYRGRPWDERADVWIILARRL